MEQLKYYNISCIIVKLQQLQSYLIFYCFSNLFKFNINKCSVNRIKNKENKGRDKNSKE